MMRKTAGSKLRELLRILDGRVLIGKTDIGHAALDNKHPILNSIKLRPEFKGLGLGRKLHIQSALAQPNNQLYSHSMLSPDSVNVWKSLQRRYPDSVQGVTSKPIWYPAMHGTKNLAPKQYTGDPIKDAIYRLTLPKTWSKQSAYTAGYQSVMEKQGAKIDKLLRAGKLSEDALERYADFVDPNKKLHHKFWKRWYNRLPSPAKYMDHHSWNPSDFMATRRQVLTETRKNKARFAMDNLRGTTNVAGGPVRVPTGRVSQLVHTFRTALRDKLENLPTLQTGGLPVDTFNYLKSLEGTSKPTARALPYAPILDLSDTARSKLLPSFWGKYKGNASYSYVRNAIQGVKPGLPEFRHELGHWADWSLRKSNPVKHDILLRTLLAKARIANPQSFNVLSSYRKQDLDELLGHYLAARGGRGGATLRAVTNKNWKSDWADKIRSLYGPDDPAASVIEHIQRNYGVPGGKISRPRFAKSSAYSEGYASVMKAAGITLDIEKGDTLLGGRFKNHKTVVKDIGKDELGQPTVNGMKLLAFRIAKAMPK